MPRQNPICRGRNRRGMLLRRGRSAFDTNKHIMGVKATEQKLYKNGTKSAKIQRKKLLKNRTEKERAHMPSPSAF